MNFIKQLFRKKEAPIKNYLDFWNWFQENEKIFFNAVKNKKNLDEIFFEKLSSKLAELKDGYYFLTGMCDENTVELIFTAEGDARNIVFVEELVEQAPKINGWKFTAHKPPANNEEFDIEMGEYKFCKDNLHYYSNDHAEYPDEIDICVIHDDWTEANKDRITRGVYIFLDNYLGELNFLNIIDNLQVIGKNEAKKELIPISKLSNFLTQRQNEFVEKYEGLCYNTENQEHSILEIALQSGNQLIAVINTQLLNWDSKASHPWIAIITFKYNGSNTTGMPNNNDFNLLDDIEEILLQELSDSDGYLYIGRQTGDNERIIFFACKDFRKPSKIFFKIQQEYINAVEIEYDIYKDKYWQSFERFEQKKDK